MAINQYGKTIFIGRKEVKERERLPDFLIIGAAKSGTSTLFKYLSKHEQIFIPANKELEFFCNDLNYNKGLSWYKSQFADVEKYHLCGDASTTYTRWPHKPNVPERIAKTLEKIKFIYVMRHPVERSFSHYVHHMRSGVTKTFEEALAKDDIYINCSKYMMQIERYLPFFPKDSFLFITLDDLKQNPHLVLKKIQNFLGIKDLDIVSDSPIIANKSKPDFYLRARSTDRLLKIRGISKLKQKLPQTWKDFAFDLIKKSPIGKKWQNEYNIPPLQPTTRKKLLKIFYEDTKKLEIFINCDLKNWFI